MKKAVILLLLIVGCVTGIPGIAAPPSKRGPIMVTRVPTPFPTFDTFTWTLRAAGQYSNIPDISLESVNVFRTFKDNNAIKEALEKLGFKCESLDVVNRKTTFGNEDQSYVKAVYKKGNTTVTIGDKTIEIAFPAAPAKEEFINTVKKAGYEYDANLFGGCYHAPGNNEATGIGVFVTGDKKTVRLFGCPE